VPSSEVGLLVITMSKRRCLDTGSALKSVRQAIRYSGISGFLCETIGIVRRL
jgi:hypothetical protein